MPLANARSSPQGGKKTHTVERSLAGGNSRSEAPCGQTGKRRGRLFSVFTERESRERVNKHLSLSPRGFLSLCSALASKLFFHRSERTEKSVSLSRRGRRIFPRSERALSRDTSFSVHTVSTRTRISIAAGELLALAIKKNYCFDFDFG